MAAAPQKQTPLKSPIRRQMVPAMQQMSVLTTATAIDILSEGASSPVMMHSLFHEVHDSLFGLTSSLKSLAFLCICIDGWRRQGAAAGGVR